MHSSMNVCAVKDITDSDQDLKAQIDVRVRACFFFWPIDYSQKFFPIIPTHHPIIPIIASYTVIVVLRCRVLPV